MAKLLYQGHASLRLTTNSGKVIYVDPFAGEGYEPTADLDAESAAAIVALLREVAAERAVLVATHDPALAAAARLVVAL